MESSGREINRATKK